MVDETNATTKRPQNPRLRRILPVYQRIDGAIFTVEAAVVSAATALMTLFIFLDLTFTFLNGLRVRLFSEAGRAGGLEQSRVAAMVLASLLVLALVVAGVRAHPGLAARGQAARWGAGAALLAGIGGFSYLLVTAHPSTTCVLLAALGLLYAFLRLRRAIADGAYSVRAYAIWALAGVLLIGFCANVPDRYSSWTQPYALFLLLWTGFIGASMATSRGRHLKIDAVRKTLPVAWIGRYNFVSYLLAATITGVFCYLAVQYTLARLGNVAPAGEIPDWLKVLAIPVSLFFITFRFAVRAVLNLLGWTEPAGEEGLLLADAEEAAP